MQSNATLAGFDTISQSIYRSNALNLLLGMETAFLFAAKFIAETTGAKISEPYQDVAKSFSRIKLDALLLFENQGNTVFLLNGKDQLLQKHLITTYIDLDKLGKAIATRLNEDSQADNHAANTESNATLLNNVVEVIIQLREKIARVHAQQSVSSQLHTPTVASQVPAFFINAANNDEINQQKSILVNHAKLKKFQRYILGLSDADQPAAAAGLLRDLKIDLQLVYDRFARGITFNDKLPPLEPDFIQAKEHYLDEAGIIQLSGILGSLPDGKIKDKGSLSTSKRLQYYLETVIYLTQQLEANQTPDTPMIPLDELPLDAKEDDEKRIQSDAQINLFLNKYPTFAYQKFIKSKIKLIYEAVERSQEYEDRVLQNVAHNRANVESLYLSGRTQSSPDMSQQQMALAERTLGLAQILASSSEIVETGRIAEQTKELIASVQPFKESINIGLFKDFNEAATDAEKDLLLIERYYTMLFAVKLIKKYSQGSASLSYQYQYIFNQLHLIELDATPFQKDSNLAPEIIFNDSLKFEQEKSIVSKHLNLNILAVKLISYHLDREEGYRNEYQRLLIDARYRNEYQRLLIDALEGARQAYEKVTKLTPQLIDSTTLALFYKNLFALKFTANTDPNREAKTAELSEKKIIEYTDHNPEVSKRLKKILNEAITQRSQLFTTDKITTTSIYYTDYNETALVDTRILRDYILNTRLSKFFNTKAIIEETYKHPARFTELITRLGIVCIVIGKGINRLSGNLLVEHIVQNYIKESTTLEIEWAYDQYGADNRKLIYATCEITPNRSHYFACRSLFNFDTFADHLNMIIKSDVKSYLVELTKLYLDAYNMYLHLRILRIPLGDRVDSIPEPRCISTKILKKCLDGMDNKLKSKAWHELMKPKNAEQKAIFTLTPAPVVVKLEENEERADNSKHKKHKNKKDKDKDKQKQRKIILSTLTANTSEADATSDQARSCNDEKSASTSPSSAENKSVIATRDSITLKSKKETLERELSETLMIFKSCEESLNGFQKSFTSKMAAERDSVAAIKRDIADVIYYKDGINTEVKAVKKELEELSLQSIEPVRNKLSAINTSLSVLKTKIQNLKPRVATELFLIERDKNKNTQAAEEKPRRIVEKNEARWKAPIKKEILPNTRLQQPVQTLKRGTFGTAEKAEKDYSAPLRLQYLNQSCKHLIFLNKILGCQTEEEEKRIYTPDVTHFALLFNIFRCFQSLKMYQTFGGSNKNIDDALVTDLRNMIIHHGAMMVEEDEVIQFAKTLQGTLPEIVINLQTEHLLRFEVRDDVRAEIIMAFNLTEITPLFSLRNNHANLIVDNTAFYRALHDFHQDKKSNNYPAEAIKGEINFVYIPAIKKIGAALFDKNYNMTPERFVDTFLFEIQALLMLVTIVGEWANIVGFNDSFVNYCKNYRNIVGHALSEMNKHDDYVRFIIGLKAQLSQGKNYRGQFFGSGTSSGSRPSSSTALPPPAPK